MLPILASSSGIQSGTYGVVVVVRRAAECLRLRTAGRDAAGSASARRAYPPDDTASPEGGRDTKGQRRAGAAVYRGLDTVQWVSMYIGVTLGQIRLGKTIRWRSVRSTQRAEDSSAMREVLLLTVEAQRQ